MPEGELVAGVTSLAGEIYVLRWKWQDQVEVYDVVSYRLLRCLTVPNCRVFADMTSCEHHHCVYIADPYVYESVHRLDAQGAATMWPVDDQPSGLSVNAARNVLVTCRDVGKIKEFTTHGNVVREVRLPGDVVNPYHSLQSVCGLFFVCHGHRGDAVHGVCAVTSDGRRVVHSFGGPRGSDAGQCNMPRHLAADRDESVLFADRNNRRVTLLSATLDYVRHAVPSAELNGEPFKLFIDTQRRRLYVASDEWKDGKYTTGRVIVFSV